MKLNEFHGIIGLSYKNIDKNISELEQLFPKFYHCETFRTGFAEVLEGSRTKASLYGRSLP